MIGDGFTRFANPVSVSLVKQAVSLKPKLEPVSVSMDHALSKRSQFGRKRSSLRVGHGSGPSMGRVGWVGFGHKILRLGWVGLGRV